MKLFKIFFKKIFLYNRNQHWILLALIIAMVTAICYHKPTCQWLCDIIENNLLLFTSISVILFIKMVLLRLYYVSQIQEGKSKARGCAGSSCLLTLILAICIIIFTLKCCKQYSNPTVQKVTPKVTAQNLTDKSQIQEIDEWIQRR